MADPWGEFADAPKSAKPDPWGEFQDATPTGDAHDGDTFRLRSGANARLSGVDAFELQQPGYVGGKAVPLGQKSQQFLKSRLSPKSSVVETGTYSYGRPVVLLRNGNEDVGQSSVNAGMSVPAPSHLDPKRLKSYVDTQRKAIAAERGAYAGQYQLPSDYRHQGDAAPMRGKIPMTPRQQSEWSSLLRNPKTTEAQLAAWMRAQGHNATNLGNIASFMQRNPNAGISPYFQQEDVTNNPVLPDGPALPTRLLAALNEGIPDTLGAPVDLVNAGLSAVGLPMSDKPIMGSEWLRSGMNRLGIGQTSEAFAPRSTLERYGQSVSRGIGQAAIPAGGLLSAGGRMLATASPLAVAAGNPIRQAGRTLLMEAARNPGLTLAGEAGAGIGAGVGGQYARDKFPGNPVADLAGQTLGGLVGGFGAGVPFVRRPRAPEAAPHVADAFSEFADAPQPTGDASQPTRAPVRNRAPVKANMAAVKDGDTIGPASLLDPYSVPPAGKPGISVINDDGHLATAVYRDESGKPRGVVRIPLSEEARQYYDSVSSYVDPGYRRQGIASRLYDALHAAGHPIDELSGTGDLTPDGAALVNAWRSSMSNDVTPSSISARVPDRIDVWSEFKDHQPDPVLGRARPMLDKATPEQVAALARRVSPDGMLPVPRSAVDTLDESLRANPGALQPVQAPNERAALPAYQPGPGMPARRDPLDLVSWLRSRGGIREDRGELASMGVDNKPRDIEFAKSEGFLGRLVDNEKGQRLDDAAQAAWEAGYFPDHTERPTISEFLDAVRETHRGGPGRVFNPKDFEAIDAYRAAQGQRHALEKAQQDGAPLVEDRGQPVTLDDLNANQPPATAYEDLPSIGGKAGNIALDRLESKEDINRALTNVDAFFGGFDAARRGKISHAETEALARELGMTSDDLLRRRHGQALNAEQALAARSILAKSGDELVGLARKAHGGSDEDLTAFHRALIRHAAIQEQVSGATAEAGRTLSQFRMAADSRLPRGRVLKELVDNAGGRDKIEDAANAILELQKVTNDPAKVNAFALQAAKPKFKDKLVELWYNSLLSGPQTHAVNMLSNAITAGLQIPEHVVASGLGAARRAVSSTEVDRVMGSEIGARIVGLMQGTKEGMRAFARTARSGQVIDPLTKVEATTHEAISGIKGKIIRTPTRMLSAEDELFKAIGRRMELNGLAVRQARMEGLKGDAFKRRVADLASNPTDDMLEQSFDYARYVTFQQPLGKLGNLATAATQHAPVLKLFVPFIRTPSNIFKFATERSPLAPVLKEWRADFAAGGARRDLAVTRMAMGTGLGLLVTQWAQDGLITGAGPADDGAKALLKADGWQPYSIRVGDKYVSYQRLDPLATTLGLAADLVGTQEYMTETQREKSVSLLVGAMIKQVQAKSWLQGVSDFFEAMNEPDRKIESYLSRLAGSIAVPNISAQVARTADPIVRDARGPIDAILARVPGASQRLPAKTDMWGEPIRRPEGVGPNLISPIQVNTRRNDPLNNALLRLGVNVGTPSRKVGGRRLGDDEFRAYKNQSGQIMRQTLSPYVQSPDWALLDPQGQEDAVDQVKRDSRAQARLGLFGAGR